jgi:hypothetical protein
MFNRRFWMVLTAIAVVEIVVALASILILPNVYWYYQTGAFLTVVRTAALLAFSLLIVTFSVKIPIGVVHGDETRVKQALLHSLRAAGRRASDERKCVECRIDSLTAVRVYLAGSNGDTKIGAMAWATPTGWSLILICTLIYYLGFIAIPAMLLVFFRAHFYADSEVRQLLGRLDLSPKAQPSLGIRETIIDGLAEGGRLAAEAFEARRSDYHDGLLLAAVAGMIAFLVSLIGLGTDGLGEWNLSLSLSAVLLAATVLAFACSIGLGYLVFTRFRNELRILNDWSNRFQTGLLIETTGIAVPDGQQSSVELMMDAWKEIPGWLRARRKAGMYRQPGTWLAILTFAGPGAILLFAGLFAVEQNPVLRVVVFGIGFAFSALAALLYRTWKRERDEEELQVMSGWSDKLAMMRSRLEQHLQEL